MLGKEPKPTPSLMGGDKPPNPCLLGKTIQTDEKKKGQLEALATIIPKWRKISNQVNVRSTLISM